MGETARDPPLRWPRQSRWDSVEPCRQSRATELGSRAARAPRDSPATSSWRSRRALAARSWTSTREKARARPWTAAPRATSTRARLAACPSLRQVAPTAPQVAAALSRRRARARPPVWRKPRVLVAAARTLRAALGVPSRLRSASRQRPPGSRRASRRRARPRVVLAAGSAWATTVGVCRMPLPTATIASCKTGVKPPPPVRPRTIATPISDAWALAAPPTVSRHAS